MNVEIIKAGEAIGSAVHFDDVRDVGGGVQLAVNGRPCGRSAGIVALPGAEPPAGIDLRTLERQQRLSCITVTITIQDIPSRIYELYSQRRTWSD